jgi:RNA polymerase sigma-70 factor (sigma-E family)
MKTPWERQVVKQMSKRDDAEFTAFVSAQWNALFRTAFLLTGDAQLAEDLTQASLTKVYLAWPRIMRMDHPVAYARKIVANQATSWWRRRSASELPADFSRDENAQPGFDDSVAQSCSVWNAVLALPARQRAVIVLKYYEDMTVAEIADALAMAEGTVKSHTNRALATLGGLLAETPSLTAGGES